MAWPAFVKIVDGYPVVNMGAMRHQVTILQQQITNPPTYDASGVAGSTYAPFATGVLAAIETVRGTDVIKGGQDATQLFLTVGIWWAACPGALPNMRVLSDNGSTYVIQSVENILEMDVVLLLNCLGLGANV